MSDIFHRADTQVCPYVHMSLTELSEFNPNYAVDLYNLTESNALE